MHTRWRGGQGWWWALALLAMACGDSQPAGSPDTSKPSEDEGQLVLPAPTGPYPVGKLTVALVDPSRGGLFPGEPRSGRELVVHIWYPREPQPQAPAASYSSPLLFSFYNLPAETAERIQPHAVADAPLSSAQPAWPVVLFSHGYGATTELYTSLLEELASQGYVVVGIDHTFLAALTVFPDGRAVARDPVANLDQALLLSYSSIVAEDVSFVLDQLERWSQGNASGRFSNRLDLARTGYFGHSLGGITALRLLEVEPRIQAAANLDGPIIPGQATLSKPVLLLLAESTPARFPAVERFFRTQLAGPGYKVVVEGARHNDFSDIGLLVDALNLQLPPEVQSELGPIDSERAVALTRAYLVAFLDLHLRGQPSPLLEGPPAAWPEVRFERR